MRGQGEFQDVTCRLMAKCCSLDSHLIVCAIEAIQQSETGGYTTTRLSKKSGGFRTIDEPCEPLKLVQASLLHFLYRWPTDERMFGFQPGCSPVGNARYHIWEVEFGRDRKKIKVVPRWILTVDLKDAFPSVKADLLEAMYREMFEKSRLNRFPGLKSAEIDSVYEEFIELMLQLTVYRGQLPQGAPTSPYLLNLALLWTGVVQRIVDICSARKATLKFSIYADDITISSLKVKFSDSFIRKLIAAIEESGWFEVNPKKTLRNSRKYKAHKITGVVLTTGEDGKPKLTLPQRTLRSWRGVIHRAAVELREFNQPDFESNYATISRALGYVAWIKDVYRSSGQQMPPSVRTVVEEFEEVWSQLQQRRRKAKAESDRQLLMFLKTLFGAV